MINVLIVDEDMETRKAIKALLNNQGNINEIFEAADSLQASYLCQLHQTDLIFLNNRIPKYPTLKKAVQLQARTVVIAMTSGIRCGATVLDVDPIDYLLKPFDPDQFYSALKRANKQISQKRNNLQIDWDQMSRRSQGQQVDRFLRRLVIKEQGRIRLIDVAQINYIVGAGNYAEIHLFEDKQVLHREKLSQLENLLDPALFLRIHRSFIVRRSSISELYPNKNGDYKVVLKNDVQLTLSRKHKGELEQLIGK